MQFLRQDLCDAGELFKQSRTVGNVRHSHRILAIRDILLGCLRKDVCVRYGVSRENLRHWVTWYVDACQNAWNKMTEEKGRIKSLTNFHYLHFPYLQSNII